VDITEYQHPGGSGVNWSQVRQSGIKFATLKATRGTNFINPYFKNDLADALAQGIPTAPYHFLIDYDPGTAGAQANYFINAARAAGYTGHRPGELPPILDLEWTDDGNSNCPPHTTVAEVQTWLNKVQDAFGVKPMIYTSRGFMTDCMNSTTAFGSYLLQVADYIRSHTSPSLPPGWQDWLMWQYTNVGSVPGVPTTNVTLDVFNGTQDQLDKLAHHPNNATQFADINGDGLDEIIAIHPNGDVWAYHNVNGFGGYQGDQVSLVAKGFTDGARTKFADINGDGLDEIIAIHPNGDVWAYHNVNGFGGYRGDQVSLVAKGFVRP
jgi:GH25 family lysozyme M1 (1,4-beta-N-acetylmuramidase)